MTKDDILKLTDSITTYLRGLSKRELDVQFSKEEQEAFSELLNWLSSGSTDKFEQLIQDLFSGLQVEQSRLDRYRMYDHVYSLVPLCKRVLRVYRSQMLLRDPITGARYIIRTSPLAKDEKKEVLGRAETIARNIIESYRIFRRLRNRDLPTLLKRGDCFTEIVPVYKLKMKSDHSVVLTEAEVTQLANLSKHSRQQAESELLRTLFTIVEEEEVQQKETSKHHVVLRSIPPERVVPLVSKYGSVYGYIEVMPMSMSVSRTVGQRMASTLLNLAGVSVDKGIVRDTFEDLAKRLSQRLLNTLAQKYDFSVTSLDDILQREFSVQVADFIKNMYFDLQSHQRLSQGKIRFIPVKRMVWGRLVSDDFWPFGASVLDPMVLPGRMYILTLLANLVIKTSRAAVIRKWIVEVGAKLQHMNIVQQVVRETRNKLTIDEIATLKSLPRILTEFKDMILMSKGGQRFIDVEIQSMGDPNIKTADLEELRRELIAASGVPAPFLGFVDVVELREQLVHANVTFANTISDYQEHVNDYLTDLVSTIARYIMPDDEVAQRLDELIEIRLIPPVVLMLQFLEQTMGSLSNLVQMFRGLGVSVDPMYLMRTYMPYVDWDEFEKNAMKAQVETDITGTGSTGGAGY